MKRFSCIRQLERSDCGPTCIRMVARHYGKEVSRRHIADISDMSRLGMSIRDMISCFEKLGIEALPVKIGVQWFKDMPLPAVLHWNQSHFVVLHRYDHKRKRFHIADPAQGKVTYGEEEFLRFWTGDEQGNGLAVLTDPNEEFSTDPIGDVSPARRFISYLGGYMRMHKSNFLIVLLLSVVMMAADFAVPLLLKTTVDEGISSSDIHLVWLLLGAQLAVAVGGLVGGAVMDLLLTRLGLRMHLGMIKDFLAKLAAFPLSFFDRKVSSDFFQKIQDHQRIKDFLITFPNSMFFILLSLVVFSVLLFHYSPLIFGFFLFMSLLEIGWNLLFLKRRKAVDNDYFTRKAINSNHAYELANGMADLKVNNAERSRISEWNRSQEDLNSTTMKSVWLEKFQGGGLSVITNIKNLSITGIAGWLVIGGDMTMGTLMTLSYLTGRLARPISSISSSLTNAQMALLSFERVRDIVEEHKECRGELKPKDTRIALDGVWFKYAGTASPFVIRDLSLVIEPGTVTAIVGESGCGKSTLLKLMLGFYIPQQGEISLGGNDVRDTDNREWLSHCGAVMQEPRIFSGTILHNVALSDDIPDEKRAVEALEAVGLDEFVLALPMGIRTKIGVEGVEMSGGQKQRLMIARALYKDPDILMLDEATSSLDANNERMIVERLNSFRDGKTVIISAHRLSTVRDADRIVFMKGGRIAEMGTHEELLEKGGDYWRLVHNQLQLEEKEPVSTDTD